MSIQMAAPHVLLECLVPLMSHKNCTLNTFQQKHNFKAHADPASFTLQVSPCPSPGKMVQNSRLLDQNQATHLSLIGMISVLPKPRATTLPRSKWASDDEDDQPAAPVQAPVHKGPPPYGKRQGFVPRTAEVLGTTFFFSCRRIC